MPLRSKWRDEIGQQAVDQLQWGHNILLMYAVSDKNDASYYIPLDLFLDGAIDILKKIKINL